MEGDVKEAVSTLHRIPGRSNCDKTDVMEWLCSGEDDNSDEDVGDRNFIRNETANKWLDGSRHRIRNITAGNYLHSEI